MKKILYLLALFLAGLVLFLIFSKRSSPDYIFLITIDTTRADHIDYSPTNNSRTPNLGRLAAAGMYFENAYSVIPITFPSHAAMFYSLPPHVFKIYNNGQERFTALSRSGRNHEKQRLRNRSGDIPGCVEQKFWPEQGVRSLSGKFPAPGCGTKPPPKSTATPLP